MSRLSKRFRLAIVVVVVALVAVVLYVGLTGDLSPLYTWTVHSPVQVVQFSPDGRYVAAGTDAGVTRLWRVQDHQQVRLFGGEAAAVTALRFSPDGLLLAIGSGRRTDAPLAVAGTVAIWRVEDGTLVRTLQGHLDSVTTLAFSDQGRWLASGSRDATVRLWDPSEGRQLAVLPVGSSAAGFPFPIALAFSADGSALTAGTADDAVWRWSVPTGAALGHQQSAVSQGKGVKAFTPSLALSNDGQTAASSSASTPPWGYLWQPGDGRVQISLGRRDPIWGFPGGPSASLAFSPDGHAIAGGPGRFDPSDEPRIFLTQRWRIFVWQVPSGLERARLKGHRDAVPALAWSPDSAILASGSLDGTVRLWAIK